MTGCADHEGLAPSSGHDSHPFGLVWLSRPGEVGELADLMHLHPVRVAADLAPSRQESADQLSAMRGRPAWLAIGQDRVLLPPERDTTEGCDQRPMVSVVAENFRAILATEERCLFASVMSRDLRMTQ